MIYRVKRNNERLHGLIEICYFILPILLIVYNCFYLQTKVERLVLMATFLVAMVLFCSICSLSYWCSTKTIIENVFLVFVGIGLGVASTVINSSGYGSIVQYAALLLLITSFMLYPISKRQRMLLLFFTMVSIGIILVAFPLLNEVDRNYYALLQMSLTEYINPNTIGLLYLFLFIFVSFLIEEIKNAWARIGMILLFLPFFAYFIYLSESRTALSALILYCVFLLFTHIRKIPVLLQILASLGLFATVAVTFAYVKLYEHTSGELIFLGKNLFTGRQTIYQEIYSILREHWLWGYNNRYLLWEGRLKSTHNALLGIWFSLGLFPTLIFCLQLVKSFGKKVIGNMPAYAKCAFFALLLPMSFESLLTDSLFYFYFCILFLRERETEEKVRIR